MKKLSSFFYFGTLLLLLNISAAAQAKDVPVEKANTSIFSVQRLNLVERRGELQLVFTISNIGKISTSGLRVQLSAYNRDGSLMARQCRTTYDEIFPRSRFSSVLDVHPMLEGAFRYSTDFMLPASDFAENENPCAGCTDDAIRACGAGKVSEVTCTQGGTPQNPEYLCSYKCKANELDRLNIINR